MATAFNLFCIGDFAELGVGTLAENPAALVGRCLGSRTAPLFEKPQREAFSTTDIAVTYDATVTYTDGVSEQITIEILHDTEGALYVDRALMEERPIVSITINHLSGPGSDSEDPSDGDGSILGVTLDAIDAGNSDRVRDQMSWDVDPDSAASGASPADTVTLAAIRRIIMPEQNEAVEDTQDSGGPTLLSDALLATPEAPTEQSVEPDLSKIEPARSTEEHNTLERWDDTGDADELAVWDGGVDSAEGFELDEPDDLAEPAIGAASDLESGAVIGNDDESTDDLSCPVQDLTPDHSGSTVEPLDPYVATTEGDDSEDLPDSNDDESTSDEDQDFVSDDAKAYGEGVGDADPDIDGEASEDSRDNDESADGLVAEDCTYGNITEAEADFEADDNTNEGTPFQTATDSGDTSGHEEDEALEHPQNSLPTETPRTFVAGEPATSMSSDVAALPAQEDSTADREEDKEVLDLSAGTAGVTVTYAGDEPNANEDEAQALTFEDLERAILGTHAGTADPQAENPDLDALVLGAQADTSGTYQDATESENQNPWDANGARVADSSGEIDFVRDRDECAGPSDGDTKDPFEMPGNTGAGEGHGTARSILP